MSFGIPGVTGPTQAAYNLIPELNPGNPTAGTPATASPAEKSSPMPVDTVMRSDAATNPDAYHDAIVKFTAAAVVIGTVVDGGLGMANPEGEAGKAVRGAVELGDAEHAAQNAAKLEPAAAAATDAAKTTAPAETGTAAVPRSGSPGGSPTGVPERIRPSDDAATARWLQRQNESADALAAFGYESNIGRPFFRVTGRKSSRDRICASAARSSTSMRPTAQTCGM